MTGVRMFTKDGLTARKTTVVATIMAILLNLILPKEETAEETKE